LTLDCKRNYSGLAVKRRRICTFAQIWDDVEGHEFGHRELVDKLQLERMVSVPILNTSNPNQVLGILNYFPASPDDLPAEAAADPLRRELLDEAQRFAICLEAALQTRCIRAANRLHVNLSGLARRTTGEIAGLVAQTVSDVAGSDFVRVCLESADGKKIVCRGELYKIRPSADCLEDAEREVQAAWGANRESLATATGKGRSGAADAVGAVAYASAAVPLRDTSGKPKGVIVCLNIRDGSSLGGFRPFTYEDIAVIEAVGLAFVPQLEIIVAEQKHIDALNKLAHELRVPVVAFREALSCVTNESKVKGFSFTHRYLDDLQTYADVMNRLLKELELARVGPERVPLQTRLLDIEASMIAPARRFVKQLLRQRGFEGSRIKYDSLYVIPRLHLDRALMTQVVFNLLENAIKYAHRDPARFQIRIEGRRTGAVCELAFKDQGMGVPKGWETRIFEAGVRAPNVTQSKKLGDGYGLYLARELVRRHGGEIEFRRNPEWTEFVISLPLWLTFRGPPSAAV
jgi:signal transduction histidine kinase